MKAIKIVLWFVLTMAVLTSCLTLISSPNTIGLIVGIVILCGYLLLSWRTRFFTNFSNLKKIFKHEKAD